MMKGKKFLLGLAIAFVVFCGVLTGVALGKKAVASAEFEDYRSYSSDVDTPYLASDTYFCSVGWSNSSSVIDFSNLTYTGNTLYYKTAFLIGDFVVSGQSYFGVGVSFYGSTDTPTYSGVKSGVGGVDSYSGFMCNSVSFNEMTNSSYPRGWGNSGYIRVRSSQNTSRYSLIYYSIYAEDTSLTFDYVDNIEVGNYTSCPYSQIVYGDGGYLNTHINVNGYYNWVSYYFGSGSRVTFYVPTFYNSSNSYESSTVNYYSYRKYYSLRDHSENEFYQQGYDDGMTAGEQSGYNVGYGDGYNSGYGVGDTAGYNRGVNDANQYTFFNMLGAVVDAPISAFRGLFNFSILGINMADFMASLLTLCCVFLVVKFVFLK